jgi:hypothetical protein
MPAITSHTFSQNKKSEKFWECKVKAKGGELNTRAAGLAKWRKEYIKAKSHINQI